MWKPVLWIFIVLTQIRISILMPIQIRILFRNSINTMPIHIRILSHIKKSDFFSSHQYQSTLVFSSYRRLIGAIDTDPDPPDPGRLAWMPIPIRQRMRIRLEIHNTGVSVIVIKTCVKLNHSFLAELRIRDILVRIRIRRSVPLTNGSGSWCFRHWPSRRHQKTIFVLRFSAYYF